MWAAVAQSHDSKHTAVQLLHEAWYSWHKQLYDSALTEPLSSCQPRVTSSTQPSEVTEGLRIPRSRAGAPPLGESGAAATSGAWRSALLLQGAVQTGLAVRVLSGADPSVAGLTERLLLLKLVSRELQTYGPNPSSLSTFLSVFCLPSPPLSPSPPPPRPFSLKFGVSPPFLCVWGIGLGSVLAKLFLLCQAGV